VEWLGGGVLGLGLLWFCLFAMMGAGTKDNLKNFRLKLLAMCLVWPLTLVALVAVLIWKAGLLPV
jgi:hypothetical protein